MTRGCALAPWFALALAAAYGDAAGSGAAGTAHLVPLFPSASDAVRQGFVRVVNHSDDAGEVSVLAVDDAGTARGPLTLTLDGRQTVHFNSDDLETGNPGKGLAGSTGGGDGDWYLELTSDLDIEVLAYIRTSDGFLTAMHDVVPAGDAGAHRVAIFNPGSNANQVSRLRLVNVADEAARVTVAGTDDRGSSAGGPVEVTVPARAARTLTAAELEAGGADFGGALGDGAGKWRLDVAADRPIHVLSLLQSPTGHLTNLSTVPSNRADGVHEVLLFPSAADAAGRQGFVRVINRSDETAEITVLAQDETARDYDPLALTLAGGAAAHFNSDDLEQGNAAKGLSGATGAGQGDWRLALSSGSDIEVLAYIRTRDGFLTAMHDVVPVSAFRHRVAIFNPGSNTAQVSRARLVNPGEEPAAVEIRGIDDRGMSPGSRIRLTIPAEGTRTHTAQELESGGEGFEGALGDGAGKWRLEIVSDRPIRVLSLLASPTGHLTNLSTASARETGNERAEEAFRSRVSAIVQSTCVNCHVAGGDSGDTRLVFVSDSDAGHLATNFAAFEAFVAEVEGGADRILEKIRGIDHGGGVQAAQDTREYAHMERFLELLAGEKVVLRVALFGEGTVEVVGGGELACNGRSCTSLVRTGRRLTLRAAGAPGYAFDRWQSCDIVAGRDCVVVVDGDRLLFADFVSSRPLTLEDDVVTFDADRLADIEQYDPDSGLLILRAEADLEGIEVGAVLASWVIADGLGFESYFLRRVTDLRRVPGSAVFLRTAQANLDDLIASGSLSSSRPLGPEQVAAYELPAGLTPLSHPGAAMKATGLRNGRKRFDVSGPNPVRPSAFRGTAAGSSALRFKVDIEKGDLAVEGEFVLRITRDFKLDWDYKPWSFGPKEFLAKVRVEPAAELTTLVGRSKELEIEHKLPIRVSFAAVAIGPVVVVPTVTAKLVLKAEAKAGFEPTLVWEMDVEAGAHYLREEGWTGIWGFDHEATYDPGGEVAVAMQAEAGASLALGTKVYGVAGPLIRAGPYVGGEIVAATTAGCLWNYAVYVGARAGFGAEVEILGFGVEFSSNLYNGRLWTPLASASCPEGAIPEPETPANVRASMDGYYALDVSWDPWSYEGSRPVGYEVIWQIDALGDTAPVAAPSMGIGGGRRSVAGTGVRLDGVYPDAHYCFHVRTRVADNVSGFSTETCVETPPRDTAAPGTPVGVAAEAVSPSVISLAWEASDDDRGVDHYLVRNAAEAGDEGRLVGGAYDLRVDFAELNPDTEYCFGVAAVDAAGNVSDQSATACATTPREPNWRFRAACTGRDYQVLNRFHLDEEFGGTLFALLEAQDYDGEPTTHALTGIYDKTTSLLDGKVFWWFGDAAGVRTDTFEADLSLDDTGDIATEKSGSSAGCDLVVRFDRFDPGEESAARPLARSPSTAGSPGGEPTIRRRR